MSLQKTGPRFGTHREALHCILGVDVASVGPLLTVRRIVERGLVTGKGKGRSGPARHLPLGICTDIRLRFLGFVTHTEVLVNSGLMRLHPLVLNSQNFW